MCILLGRQDNYRKNYILDYGPLLTSHLMYLLFAGIASDLSGFLNEIKKLEKKNFSVIFFKKKFK